MYRRNILSVMVDIAWDKARTTVERAFRKIDTETQSIKDEMERIDESENLLNDRIVICAITDDFNIVYDNAGDMVTLL